MPRGGDLAQIVRMSVERTSRQRGLGRQIVEELVTTAAEWGVSAVVLETTSAWLDVVRFYQACGFVITHVEDGGDFGSNTWFERRLDCAEQNDAGRRVRYVCASAMSLQLSWLSGRPLSLQTIAR